jgi:cobyrinic acid a,c-diamide synthase
VQPFKKGPDYIDPMWLGRAAGRGCHNLDFHTSSPDEILETYARHVVGADIAVIEGNKGLYDGMDVEGSNSNAAMAKLLGTPVVLVIDAQGMTRGIAPLILGYQAFDTELRIAGVILNKLGGSRHESKLRAVVERYTDVPVLGAVHRRAELEIVERHLGLVPSNEDEASAARIDQIAEIVGQAVDLEALVGTAAEAAAPPTAASTTLFRHRQDLRIGVARDAAFGFYYPGDLQALQDAGAQLITIDTLRDQRLPAIDGLFIGGGFPETQMEALERNAPLRAAIREAIEAGLPTYAECGGLMYLARSLRWRGRRCDMVGAIPADTVMHERPQGRGYVRLRPTGRAPWTVAAQGEIRAHEFHYSSLVDMDPALEYAYEVKRGTGVDGHRDGIVYKNLLASYAHLRDTAHTPWARRFVEYVRALGQEHAAAGDSARVRLETTPQARPVQGVSTR